MPNKMKFGVFLFSGYKFIKKGIYKIKQIMLKLRKLSKKNGKS